MILAGIMSVALVLPALASDERKMVLDPPIKIQRGNSGAAERLELADKLRLLSQEVPASACYLFNGISPDSTLYRLEKAKKHFPRYLNALEFGDASFNINDPETQHSIRRRITKIDAHWASVDEAIYRLTYVSQDAEAVSQLNTETDALFKLTSRLMSELEAKYSEPFELTTLDAMLLDIAGRQTALTQKISKLSCEIWAGDRSEDRIRNLTQSITLFERGISALLDGLPELGIIPAPTPKIETGLAVMVADWGGVREMLGQVVRGDADKDQMTVLYGRLSEKRAEMAAIVGLYAAYSKRIY